MQGIIAALEANAVLIGMIVGSVMPPLIALVQQPNLSTATRKRIATAAAVVVGVLVAASTGQLDGFNPADLGNFTDMTVLVNLMGVVGAVWAASEATFHKLWRPSGVSDAVEHVTSPWVKPEPADEAVPEDLETK